MFLYFRFTFYSLWSSYELTDSPGMRRRDLQAADVPAASAQSPQNLLTDRIWGAPAGRETLRWTLRAPGEPWSRWSLLSPTCTWASAGSCSNSWPSTASCRWGCGDTGRRRGGADCPLLTAAAPPHPAPRCPWDTQRRRSAHLQTFKWSELRKQTASNRFHGNVHILQLTKR